MSNEYIPSWVFKVGTFLVTVAIGLLGITFVKILEINSDIAILKERTEKTSKLIEMVYDHEGRIKNLEHERGL